MAEDLDHLLQLERRFWTGDAAFYHDSLTSDFLMVFAGMGIVDREQTIAGIADGQRWDAVEIEEPRFVRLSDTSAILAYRARARRGDEPYSALIGSAYVHEGDAWLLAYHHQTPLDD